MTDTTVSLLMLRRKADHVPAQLRDLQAALVAARRRLPERALRLIG